MEAILTLVWSQCKFSYASVFLTQLWPYARFVWALPECLTVPEHRRLISRLVDAANTVPRVLPDLFCSWESSRPGAPVLKLSAELADWPPPVNCCTYWAAPQHHIWGVGELPKPSSQAGPLGCLCGCIFRSVPMFAAILLKVTVQSGQTHSFPSVSLKNCTNKCHPGQSESSHTKDNCLLPFSSPVPKRRHFKFKWHAFAASSEAHLRPRWSSAVSESLALGKSKGEQQPRWFYSCWNSAESLWTQS